jgi:CubicO group peptidase (beta-lactamase class C family)
VKPFIRIIIVALAFATGVSTRAQSSSERERADQHSPHPRAQTHSPPATASIDRFMEGFLQEHKVPGVSVAIAKDGRLVYARGFGWANREKKIPVRPESLFRIASISKPITAVAILKLVELGAYKLDDRMVDLLKDMPEFRREKWDKRMDRITVRDLLRHSGGWDRAKLFDPMGLSGHLMAAKELGITPPCSPRDMMRFMFRRPLQFDPGTDFAYSNFGYVILGRIIEHATGKPYEQFVKERLLAPIGVTGMRIGKMAAEDRADSEVRYYDEKKRTGTAPFGPRRGKVVASPYARPIQVMDAHGGWIASAVDLVRFACAIDQYQLLNRKSTAAMFARPPGTLGHTEHGTPKASYYALGWSVRPKSQKTMNTWHSGSIQGTSTLLVRRHDGFNWAVLFNSGSTPDNKRLSGLIDPAMHRLVNEVNSWPDVDLFQPHQADSSTYKSPEIEDRYQRWISKLENAKENALAAASCESLHSRRLQTHPHVLAKYPEKQFTNELSRAEKMIDKRCDAIRAELEVLTKGTNHDLPLQDSYLRSLEAKTKCGRIYRAIHQLEGLERHVYLESTKAGERPPQADSAREAVYKDSDFDRDLRRISNAVLHRRFALFLEIPVCELPRERVLRSPPAKQPPLE